MHIAVVGLGKLGLPLAALYANAGHHVHGVDSYSDHVSRLKAGTFRSVEPGLNTMLKNSNLDYHHGMSTVPDAHAVFIAVPTPSHVHSGAYTLGAMTEAINDVGYWIKQHRLQRSPHAQIVVIVSTVNPGDMSSTISPLLTRAAGGPVGVVYSPEFIALGNVFEGMESPDFVLLGCEEKYQGKLFEDVVTTVIESGTPILSTTWQNAELAKIAINSFVTMKISFANMIGRLCETFEGGNADAVTQIIGSDHRIGSSYLKPGGPYGGPCFPRDNKALQAFAKSSGAQKCYSSWAADQENQLTIDRIVRKAYAIGSEHPPSARKYLVVGMAYKEGTTVSDHSLGSMLLRDLAPLDGRVDVWDRDQVGWSTPPIDEFIVLLAAPDPWYAQLDYSKALAVIDVWGLLEPAPNVVLMGRG